MKTGTNKHERINLKKNKNERKRTKLQKSQKIDNERTKVPSLQISSTNFLMLKE